MKLNHVLTALLVVAIVMAITIAVLASGHARMRHGQSARAGYGAGTGMIPGLQQNPLTADQQRRIMQIRQRTMTEVRSIRRDRALSSTQREERMMEARTRGHSEVMNVLTSEQKQEFENWWKQHPASGYGGAMEGRGPDPASEGGPTEEATTASGKTLYTKNCGGCHGVSGDKPSGWKGRVKKLSQSQIETWVKNGGSGMPAFKKKLNATQVTDVSKYTKKLAG